MTRQWISCCVLCALLSVRGGAQSLDLDSLYVSRPSTQELEAILDSFNVTLVNGTEPHEQWSLHDPYLFRPDSTAPSVYPLVNCLRVLREQRWAYPIPFAGGDLYNYMLDHFRNGGIELWLDAGFSTGGSETISLKAVTAYWDGRSSADPFTPITPFSVYPFIHRTQLIIHETRHCDAGAPPHVGGSYDQSLAQEGAYGRACIYSMWTWKHGLGISQRIRTAAGLEAKDFLTTRFVDQPATHPNPDIQAIIDELQATTISAVKADAGNDTTISIPSSAAGIPFTLNGSRSYSVYAPVVEYHWL
ncbi:MAG: hypothetical protein IT282_03410, partial [Bacteroidetes bacterium]|nr:hypothetical protein [Bacteroidota bacterium]